MIGIGNAKTVVLRAPLMTMSGYGVHARQIARWLLAVEKTGRIKLHCQPVPWGDTPWLIDKNRCDGMIGEIMVRSSPCPGKPDVSFQLQLPNEWDPNFANYNVGITAGVETDRCNPDWITACNRMQHVIVPSEHAKKAFQNTGALTTKMDVIPESYPDCFREEKVIDLGLTLDTKFNILVFGQLTGNNVDNDRKNIFNTVKWLCEVFKNDKDVGIILKTNGGRNSKIDRHKITVMMSQLLAQVRPEKNPKVHVLHGDMSDVEVLSLLRHPTVKCMVSLTRGEGFGLPLLEAAAVGLPIIATNWSAHTEFLNLGKWVQVEHRVTEIHESRVDKQIFVKGARWAQPNEDHFKRRIRKFYESNSVPREWAKDLQEKILREYSHERIASLYDEQFRAVL